MATIKFKTLFLVIFSLLTYGQADNTKISSTPSSSKSNTQKLDDKTKYETVKNTDKASNPDNADDYDYYIEYVDDDGNLVDYDADYEKYFCENCDKFFEEEYESEGAEGETDAKDEKDLGEKDYDDDDADDYDVEDGEEYKEIEENKKEVAPKSAKSTKNPRN